MHVYPVCPGNDADERGDYVQSPVGKDELSPTSEGGADFALTLLLYLGVDGQLAHEPATMLEFGFMLIKELMVGFALGFSMELAYAVIRFASAIMDYTMGLSMAQVYDPQYNTQMTITSGIYYALLSLLFLTTNGHLRMIGLFYTSAELIPFGEVTLRTEIYQLMLEIFKANIALGLQLAFPLIAMELVTEAAIGILMRMIPQINVFSVNFQMKIIVGLMMMVLLFSPMADKMYVIIDNTFMYMEQLLQLMRPLG